MTVQAEKAIWFRCEKCKRGQYADYSLELQWYKDRSVMGDNILCEYCGFANHIIEEL